MKRDFWTEWRGDLHGRVVMQIKQLCCVFGWRVDLHRFVVQTLLGHKHAEMTALYLDDRGLSAGDWKRVDVPSELSTA